jgi:hypothetical protein
VRPAALPVTAVGRTPRGTAGICRDSGQNASLNKLIPDARNNAVEKQSGGMGAHSEECEFSILTELRKRSCPGLTVCS